MVVRRDNTKAVTQRTDVAYHDADGVTGLGYDAAGNLLGNRQVSDGDQGNATTTKYDYQSLNGSYQQTGASTWRGVFNGTKPPDAATKTWRDANGFVSNIEQTTGAADERFNRAFVNDAQGNAVYVNQGAGHTGRVQNQPGGYLGGWVGDSVNPGHVQRQLVANGEVLARYGDAPDSENPPNPGDIPKYVDTAEFRLNAAPLKLKGANLDAIAYTVVGGETLKDIARNVLGDAKLWWRIAEANGLAVSGDGQLAAGQTLSVPKLALNANNVDTFQPYDPSRVTGSMDPNLPAPAGQGGGGCGGLGKIIMVAIAVVVSVYTAGLMSGASGSLLTTMQAGMGVMSGGTLGGAVGTFVAGSMSTAGVVTTAAAAGAMGSIASQIVGNAIGAQDGFNWKGVALSALGSGVTSGLGASGLLPTTDSVFANAALRQAVSSTISQGVGVVTGLQQRFDWKSVAAGAVGAGVGASVGQALQSANAFSSLGGGFGTDLARGAVSGFAGGMVTAVMRGGRVSVQQVATDAFGNALGQSLAAGSQLQPESIYSLGGTGAQLPNQDALAQRQSEYDQMVDSFGNPNVYGRDDDVLLAAGPGYSGGMGQSDRDRNIARMLEIANRPDASSMESIRQADGMGSTGIGSGDRWIPNGSSDLDGGTVVGGKMTQAEMDEFDRLNASEVDAARIARYGSISAYQPSAWERTWLSPEVQHVMNNTITGKVVGSVVNTAGSIAASIRSDRYNFATGRTLNPVEQRNARIDSVLNLGASLIPGGGAVGMIRTEMAEARTLSAAAARRMELNAKFGRSGNLDLDINARGAASLRNEVDRLVSEGHAVGRHGERVTELGWAGRWACAMPTAT
ncbi:LysM peptidoglycan-binding domain-containing protein [Acidovorax sp. SUPP2539]|uniref:LysM peptidoglycan-binding domain-containing protein n=1 Tax=Acidovorax sp. SUPP2539 TaxID=2920878 RepID=UPI0023DE55F2|nr:LysM peptidoglycan-binding domain-containing protein [Acidovorax sp. SUPP2539]GKS92667.1 hypothetical protein AVTE2539_24900 [Acidovorax sp. SUPP2539]